jgi:GT2 family glycosyltransferase
MSQQIPKKMHQLWIGSKPAPTIHMNTWKEKHPDFEYFFWNEQEFINRGMVFECQQKIDEIEEINGKADIMRWEILYKYGGVFLDADSICIEPFDNVLMSKPAFAGWENEEVRRGLIATGTMGFPPRHPLVRSAIDWILTNEVSQKKTNQMAWRTVGPMLLTRMYDTGLYSDLHIFPSYTFLPIHHSNVEYRGHGKIYAYQMWGSTFKSYESMNAIQLPPQFSIPLEKVSILICSYNTKASYLKDCLDSIKHQQGLFQMEIIWINDGSDELNTTVLERLLDDFKKTTRFTTVVYHHTSENCGIAYSLNIGVQMCTNELIIHMDSDDIMVKNRIELQKKYMDANTNVPICGGQIQYIGGNPRLTQTHHPLKIKLNQYMKKPSYWVMNHPTICYRKSNVLDVGNYNVNLKGKSEDFELELRMLKKYGVLHNMPEVLVYYRIHPDQVTNKLKQDATTTATLNEMIQTIIFAE